MNELTHLLPEYAKDIKLNTTSILTEEGAPDLNQKQIYLIAVSIGYALKNDDIIKSILHDAKDMLSQNDIEACQSAVIIMAMNNIYYRFTHLVSDQSFANMPAKLRMNVIGRPQIDKKDFELICLAVSALNGCGMCMDAHTHALIKADSSHLAIQSVIRITSVIHALATALSLNLK